ncbi:Chromosome transmission fidelity protein [Actinidia chinensis var. chinensis]|uniref:Chromosome transmission fidelity protein 18 homolog n=1 Tax=Actinidia chinensis var. chinensis TaxID=1590841 RepID=A0A2R6R962_ACTCC|nr:Chromosome transmission fidelity protein [Actinidia chinensis var. chinensis]
MDMEMDIPLPEELEWLEANSHLHDDFEDLNPPEPYPEEEDEFQPQQTPKPTLSIPHKPTRITNPSTIPKSQIDSKKRFRSDGPDSCNSDGRDQSEDNGIDDWLRYSKPTLSIPPQPSPTTDPSQTPKTQINCKKRFRSDGPDSSNPDGGANLEDKRGRVDDLRVENDDEDWLRYKPPQNEAAEVVEPVVIEEEKIVSRYASEIDGDCVPVTGFDGERVYAKMSRVEEDRLKKIDMRAHYSGLTSEPIQILIQKAEAEAFTKTLQASVEGQSDAILPETPVVNEKLWVDKYAPSSFMELLSDEQTNREVLLWLKQWDSCVFGSEIRTTSDDVFSSLRRHSSVAQHQKFSNRSFSGKNREFKLSKETFKVQNGLDLENNDSKGIPELWNKKANGSGPPEQKILLLCGPPGLGKTTLAHVAAKHCGYRVVEINASDDRSSSTIEGKILDVVQMNSVMADMKPKCLVIDEIDGALGDGKGAVEVILKMLSAEKKSDTGKENVAKEEHGRTSSRKKHRSSSLSRPVICICNDLYAPALRPLRQVAKVHSFVQPTVSRVVSRLKYICNKEGLKTSSIPLAALAEYTDCDIRSCLNTLQFLHKKKETLNVLEINSQVVGRKDTSKSVFEIWKEIFQKRKEKRERKFGNGCSSMSGEFVFLHSLISNRGDYDLILDGIHENVLQLHYHDPVMRKTVKCLHSLGVSDLMHQYVMRTQQMFIQVYQPAIAIAISALVAQNQKPNIEWPKSFQRCRTTLMEKKDILQSWHNKISPHISRHLSTNSFVEDSISPLLHILSPPTLRPVAVHLLSEKEKIDMTQLVNTMVSYSITYKNLKSNPLSSTLRNAAVLDASILSFDPPIVDLINFKGYTPCHFLLGAAVKQVLVHEVEKQKILQGSINKYGDPAEACRKGNQILAVEENGKPLSYTSGRAISCVGKMQNANNTSNLRQSTSVINHVSAASGSTASATASVQTSSSANKKKPSSGSFSFFDRFTKLSSKGSQNTDTDKKKPATLERDSRPLLFKFNEGYTNAVKRPVRVREFLL